MSSFDGVRRGPDGLPHPISISKTEKSGPWKRILG